MEPEVEGLQTSPKGTGHLNTGSRENINTRNTRAGSVRPAQRLYLHFCGEKPVLILNSLKRAGVAIIEHLNASACGGSDRRAAAGCLPAVSLHSVQSIT
jgi:hypothetical protein